MGSGCLKVTKYFLFLFNLLFFILGAVILGFGIWILVDKSSFISVLLKGPLFILLYISLLVPPETSSSSLTVGAYILIGVGAVTMLMGFLGCVGAVNEIRCLLGLYFTCLLLILIAQIAAGLLIYFQRNALKAEMSGIVGELIQNYNPYDDHNRTLETAWDYVQTQLLCCGWTGPETWRNNTVLQERNQTAYPCSCSNNTVDSLSEVGFCTLVSVSNTTSVDDWPVRKQGCMKGVQNWLQENLGIILGVCTGVAVIEVTFLPFSSVPCTSEQKHLRCLLGMVLSICLCKNIHTEDYTKVPKY
ncbi:CD82 antigen [Varanus komodoensis]|nr:CD82 antigen [Varanus komodoensis]